VPVERLEGGEGLPVDRAPEPKLLLVRGSSRLRGGSGRVARRRDFAATQRERKIGGGAGENFGEDDTTVLGRVKK
jgi:hypothetical protein